MNDIWTLAYFDQNLSSYTSCLLSDMKQKSIYII